MAARAVLYEAMGYAPGGEGRVEEDGIVWLDHRIVLAVEEEDWRTVVGDVPLDRQRVAHLAAELPALAEQGTARAFVTARVGEAHHGVDGADEIGP